MRKLTIFLVLLFLLIFSITYAQNEKIEHPIPMEGKDCSLCHMPNSQEEIPADSVAYSEWTRSMHGLNNVKCITCHGEETYFKADSDINTCLSCHPQEATVVNRKIPAGNYSLMCSSCHKVHDFSVKKEATLVHAISK